MASAVTYRPRTQVEVRLNQVKYREISKLTGLPLSKVQKYGNTILNKSMVETINDMEINIDKYVPAATNQLRHSLTHQLHGSKLSNNWLQMKLGTYVHYMKYVANMSSRHTRHPKAAPIGWNPIRQRNTSRGKKGSRKLNPNQWRWVTYYGAPRWVKLDDPKAQTNFYSQLILHMKKQLQKHISEEIKTLFKAGQRKPWTDKFKVNRK